MQIGSAMKELIRFRSFSLLMMFLLVVSGVEAENYYVVIGTFAEECNARKYTSEVRNVFKDVSYFFNDARRVYHVHVFRSSLKEEAQKQTVYLKNQKGFGDVWVYTDATTKPEDNSYTVGNLQSRQPRYEPVKKRTDSQSIRGEHVVTASASPTSNFLSYTLNAPSRALASTVSWTNKSGLSYISDLKGIENLDDAGSIEADNIFTFVVEDPQGKEISSEVMLVDFNKSQRITSFKTGERAAIHGTRREQMVALVCDVIGYAQETRMYNIDHLSRGRDISKNKDGIWEVRFRLKKMEVNDVAFMHETVFYDDAAVLQPSSEKELEQLRAIMQSNPEYKITIHGHCNAKGKREIRLPQVDASFDINTAYLKTASDRRLTKERARTVKNYLVNHGIAKKRIDIIGWGGLDPLARPGGADSRMNERVEFELVED
jgi:outer membrane protein OmpA-like peptidoglycan-associated protein